MPTQSSKNNTPNPINTDATSETSNSLKISLVNLFDVTSYLYRLVKEDSYIQTRAPESVPCLAGEAR